MNETWWVKHEQLDDRQKAVIDLPLDESHLILGPPGSGKTNLLLLRASQLVRSGKPHVLIIVFTRTLREFVATGGQQYAFTPDRIQTLNRWHYDFLRGEHGVRPETDADFTIERQKRLAQIQQIVTDKKLSGTYDAIILDEAQDYLPGEIDVFLRLGQVVFAAADSRQQIYAVQHGASMALEQHFANVYTLKHHYRNGEKICKVADELAKGWGGFEPLMPTCNYKEQLFPSSVTIHNASTLEAQVDEAAIALERQIKAYPDEYLGVLCPTRSCLKSVWNLIERSKVGGRAVLQSADEGYVSFEADRPVCICTIHGAKGLEFRAVHLLDAESMRKSPLNRNIAYTAVTRAKTSLSIYHSKPLPGYLESALSAVRGPVKIAKLEELFGPS
jgi:superfamily I DNA/RNA helicase